MQDSSKIETVVSMVMSASTNGNNVGINLTIRDAFSADRILTIDMSHESLALLVTGVYGIKGKASIDTNAVIARKRITQYVSFGIEDKSNLSTSDIKELVQEHLKTNYPDWFLQSDGTGSQQRKGEHTYIIRNYSDILEEADLSKFD